MARKSDKQVLEDLLEQLEPVLREAFMAAIANVTDSVVLTVLIEAIEAQNYQAAFNALGMSDAALRPISAALENIFERGGTSIVRQSFPPMLRSNSARAVTFHFDVRNPRAEKWLREQSSRMITRIQEDARVNIQTTLTTNLEAGNNPRTTALDIVGRIDPATGKRMGGLIGLTQPQELWVRNARIDLDQLSERYFTRKGRDQRFDGIVRRAIDSKTPLDKATIEKLITRYKNNLLRLRGETIGRTETIQSLNAAQFESYRQAVDNGAARPNMVQREWVSTRDGRERSSHHEMYGQKVGIDEPFTTPDGEKLMFPGDTSLGASGAETINCRCRVRFKTDWLALLDDDE